MRKILASILLTVIALSLCSCDVNGKTQTDIVLVKSMSDGDDSGLSRICSNELSNYAWKEGLSYEEISVADNAIALADALERASGELGAGLLVICVPGVEADWTSLIAEGQRTVLVSAKGTEAEKDGVTAVCADEAVCGYLAGYAVAASGVCSVGYIGVTGSAYGLGFSLGLSEGADAFGNEDVLLRYWCAGNSSPDDIRFVADKWAESGTKLFVTEGSSAGEMFAVSADTGAPYCETWTVLRDGERPFISEAFVCALIGAVKGQKEVLVPPSWTTSVSDGEYAALFEDVTGPMKGHICDLIGSCKGDPEKIAQSERVRVEFFG